MKCIFCKSEQVFTVNTRATSNGEIVWRRKHCRECNKIFSTKEEVDLSGITVIKKDGRRKRYTRTKLFCGIYNAALDTKGMDRGDAATKAERLTEMVEKRLLEKEISKIKSCDLARLVMEILLEEEPQVFLAYLTYFNTMSSAKKSQHFSKKYWKGIIQKAVG